MFMKEPSFAYDQEKGAFCRGGRCEVKKRCDRANIVLSMDTIRRYAREMRDQERAAADAPLGEASGVDVSPNRGGKCIYTKSPCIISLNDSVKSHALNTTSFIISLILS